jgi:hypothetical protein
VRGCLRWGNLRGGGMRVKRDQRGQQSAVSRRRGGGYRQCPLTTSSPLRARVKLPQKALKTLSPSAAHGPMPFFGRPTWLRDRCASVAIASLASFLEPAERRHSARRPARGLGGPRRRLHGQSSPGQLDGGRESPRGPALVPPGAQAGLRFQRAGLLRTDNVGLPPVGAVG